MSPLSRRTMIKLVLVTFGVGVVAIAGGLTLKCTSEGTCFQPSASNSASVAPSPAPSPEVAPSPPVESVSNSSNEAGWYLTKAGYLATLTEPQLDQVVKLATSGDKVALGQMIASGQAFPIKEGVKVHFEGCAGFLCSKVKIRPEGTTGTVYTLKEAIGR
jgi:hypothetical protein